MYNQIFQIISNCQTEFSDTYTCYMKGDIPSHKLSNAIANYALFADRNKVIALIDTTLFDSGKEGMVFAEDAFYYKLSFDRPVSIAYKDIDFSVVNDTDKTKDSDKVLVIYLKTGDKIEFNCIAYNKTPLNRILREIKMLYKESESKLIETNLNMDVDVCDDDNILEKEEIKNILLNFDKNMFSYNTSIYTTYNIPRKKLGNAIGFYAKGASANDAIILYDTTILGSGKEGMLFTSDAVYWKNILLDYEDSVAYKDIMSIEIEYSDSKKDEDAHLHIKTLIGEDDYKTLNISSVKKTSLKSLLLQLSEQSKINNQVCVPLIVNETNNKNSSNNLNQFENVSGNLSGITLGNLKVVEKLSVEEKFSAARGHGFAAERANDLKDRLSFKDAKIVGDDNAKNGADRIVDGVEIQSKYCNGGSRCIAECFENHEFRYYNAKGEPMQIEVPKDMYDSAVQALENRIKNGEMRGVTDPEQAKVIVKKGHYTYRQAKNIAKAGNVDSLLYDATNGTIYAAHAMGVTATISFAVAIWNGKDLNDALDIALYEGIKVSGIVFLTTVISSQLSKAGLNHLLISSTTQLAKIIGPKTSATIMNAFRIQSGASAISGAAAVNSMAKMLRGNAITMTVTTLLMSSVDISNNFSGRISGKQLFKNIANTVSSVGGGFAGSVGGATAGAALGGFIGSIIPGAGTVVGAAVGAIVTSAGAALGAAAAHGASNAILKEFIEDDADEMVNIIEQELIKLSEEYLLNADEYDHTVSCLQSAIDGTMLKNMFASVDQSKFARGVLLPIIKNEIDNRKTIYMPQNQQLYTSFDRILA